MQALSALRLLRELEVIHCAGYAIACNATGVEHLTCLPALCSLSIKKIIINRDDGPRDPVAAWFDSNVSSGLPAGLAAVGAAGCGSCPSQRVPQ